jgi:hypothetical protein
MTSEAVLGLVGLLPGALLLLTGVVLFWLAVRRR